jgi:predicted RNA-binding Zn-ribbon protein involved in translation (DUF1610 family)
MEDLSSDHKQCPFCGEDILTVATKCRYCHSIIDDNALIDQKSGGHILFKRCPYCGEITDIKSHKCRYCNSDIALNDSKNRPLDFDISKSNCYTYKRKQLTSYLLSSHGMRMAAVATIVFLVMAVSNPTQGDFVNYLSDSLRINANDDRGGIASIRNGFASIALNLMTERKDFIIFSVYSLNTSFLRSVSDEVPENPKFIGVFGKIVPVTHIVRKKDMASDENSPLPVSAKITVNSKDYVTQIVEGIKVNDYAGIISYNAEKSLDEKIAQLKERKNIDLFVITVEDTGALSLEDFSEKIINKIRGWSLFAPPLVVVVYSEMNKTMMVSVKENIFIKRDRRILSGIINDEVIPLINEGEYDNAFMVCVDRFGETL